MTRARLLSGLLRERESLIVVILISLAPFMVSCRAGERPTNFQTSTRTAGWGTILVGGFFFWVYLVLVFCFRECKMWTLGPAHPAGRWGNGLKRPICCKLGEEDESPKRN
ncbi:hypothetical protein M433DRAFT_28407 [Acidomyces richmondensis BFW]|nr:hypothetical protein M433DRAFT_28407 [Acidomyces richmondensis BFW]